MSQFKARCFPHISFFSPPHSRPRLRHRAAAVGGRPVAHPEPILSVLRIRNRGAVSLLWAWAEPGVGLRVPAGKEKAAPAVVVRAGDIHPGGLFHSKGEGRVI